MAAEHHRVDELRAIVEEMSNETLAEIHVLRKECGEINGVEGTQSSTMLPRV